MTASNRVQEGMANTRESAILSAAVEAITWTHTLEDGMEGPRKGQRVVIYPKELTKLEQVLETRDPNIDTEDGHAITYVAILEASQNFENPPIFRKEDHQTITCDPYLAQVIPEYTNIASRVATGNRGRVLVDGCDVMNSEVCLRIRLESSGKGGNIVPVLIQHENACNCSRTTPVPTSGLRAILPVQRERANRFPTARLTPFLALKCLAGVCRHQLMPHDHRLRWPLPRWGV
jgi:hypothetical protein